MEGCFVSQFHITTAAGNILCNLEHTHAHSFEPLADAEGAAGENTPKLVAAYEILIHIPPIIEGETTAFL